MAECFALLGAEETQAIDGGYSNTWLDASGEKICFVMQMRAAATLTQIGIRPSTLTGTSPTYKIGFQGLTTAGEPDGTYLGGGSPASATFSVTGGETGAMKFVTLDNSHTAARGDFLAIVIEYSSGTIDGSNRVAFTQFMWGNAGKRAIPYTGTHNGTSWTLNDDMPLGIAVYDGSTYYGNGVDGISNVAYMETDTPDEYGMAFTVPSGAATSFQCLGASLVLQQAAGMTDNWVLSLYEGTTALQQITLGGLRGLGGAGEQVVIYFDEVTLSTLTPGTEYILALHNDSTTNDLTIQTFTFGSAAEADGNEFFAYGLSPRGATRSDGGAWSYSDTDIVQMLPLVRDLTSSGGGGGGVRNPLVGPISG